jgi:hypothetical protein
MTTNPPLKLIITLFFIVIIGYLLTLNPALFRNDSPETITGCVTLGVTHPPGYPLFNLIGRAFYPFEVGNPAFTYNFMAAIIASLGACLLFVNLWTLLSKILSPIEEDGYFTPKSIACFTAALSLAFSNGYWGNAIAAKGGIYIFQMVLELTFLLFFQKIIFEKKTNQLKLYFLLFLLSIGLINHWPSQALLIPAFLLVLVLQLKSCPKLHSLTALKSITTCLTFSLIILSLYLYLPLRSHLYPILNFDAPFTSDRFTNTILRTNYVKIETMASYQQTFLPSLIQKSVYISQHLSSEFHPFAYLFILLGVFGLIKINRNLTLFCLIFLLTTILINLFYLQVTPIEFWHMDDHLLSSNWILSLFLGIGISIFLNATTMVSLPLKKISPVIITALALFLAPLTFFQNFSANNQKNEFLYFGYGLTALKSLPKNSLYFAESDYDYFSALYLRTVLNKRSDIHLFLALFLNKPFERNLLAKTDPVLLLSNLTPTGQSLLFDLIQNNYKTRPIYSTFSGVGFSELYLKDFKYMRFEPSGILTHIIQENNPNFRNASYGQLKLFWDEYLQFEIENPSLTQGLLRQACASPYLNEAQYEKLHGNLSHWDWYYSKAIDLISEPSWLAQTWFDRAEGDNLSGNNLEALQSYQIAAYCFALLGQMDKAKTALDKAKILSSTN